MGGKKQIFDVPEDMVEYGYKNKAPAAEPYKVSYLLPDGRKARALVDPNTAPVADVQVAAEAAYKKKGKKARALVHYGQRLDKVPVVYAGPPAAPVAYYPY